MKPTETYFQHHIIQAQLIFSAEKLQNSLLTLQVSNDTFSNRISIEQFKTLVENNRIIIDLVENTFHPPKRNNPPLIFDLYDTLNYIKVCFSKEPNKKLISKTDIEWLTKLESIVLQEINKRKINLFDLAYELAVSERQLIRNTKKFLGITPNNYIRILKLHKAKQYLEDFEFRTISEVSHAVGYADPHYFSQIFLDQYGVLPKVMRPA